MAPRRPFVTNPVLTAIAVGFVNPAGARIADLVLPRTPVPAEDFSWTQYPISEGFNIPDGRVGRTGRPRQLEFTGDEKSASIEDYGFDSPVPYSDIEAAERLRAAGRSNFDPLGHATMMLTETLENCREVRVANLIHNPNSYAANRRDALLGTDRFNDYVNSDPIQVIKDAITGTLIYRPNTLAMGADVWGFLNSHPKIVNAVKGNLTNEGIVTREQFVELFRGEGIQQLLVGDAWANTAKQGQTPTLERAWGKHIAALYINPLASAQGGGVTFGMTAELDGRIAGTIEDKDIGLQGGERVRVGERVKELIVAEDVGFLIQNAVD